MMQLSKTTTVVTLGAALLVGQGATQGVAADEREHQRRSVIDRERIAGVAVTGFNLLLSEPVWDFGDLGTPMITSVFAYNPDGDEPLPLTSETTGETLLATGADAEFYDAIGVTPDPNFINRPLRQIPIIVNSLAERESLPSVFEVPGTSASLSFPNGPITLDEWLEPEGVARVKCYSDGTATIKFSFERLIENGVYTLWALFGADADGDGVEDTIVPAPLGGVPNVFVPGEEGEAEIKRALNFCPLNEDSGLKVIDIAYHPDGNSFGASADLVLPGFPGLLAAPTHMGFPFNVAELGD